MCNYTTEATRLAGLVSRHEMSRETAEEELWAFIQKHDIAVTRPGIVMILDDPQCIKRSFGSFDHELPGSV
jgi:hypothetical protein